MQLIKPFHERWYVNRFHEKAHHRAMADPEYRDIKEREDGKWMSNEERGIDVAMWFHQHEIRDRITPKPWYFHVHWWLEGHGLRAQRCNLKMFWQRGRKGYSFFDVWGLDTWLATVISTSVRELKDMPPHGWPGEPMTYEEWLQILEDIAAGFESALEMRDDFKLDDAELKARFDHGVDLFREHFHSLWD